MSPHAAAAIRLLLPTGARLREILDLRWPNVDLQRGSLLLPDSKSGKKTIVLNTPAHLIVSSLPRIGEFVIAGQPASADDERPRAGFQRPWRAITRRAGLTGVRMHVSDIRMHRLALELVSAFQSSVGC
jgi:integrase